MKKLIPILSFFLILVVCNSCRNKTVVLLTKKWDCVQVENIVPPGTKLQSAQDSANAEELKSVLLALNWTFKNNMRYECAINSRVTVQGKYELMEDDRIMICTSESKNNVNRYIIRSLTENELVLSGNAANTNVVLHFRPN